MQIINISDLLMYQAQIFSKEENLINLSNFPAGIYYVRINNEKNLYVRKIVVKKQGEILQLFNHIRNINPYMFLYFLYGSNLSKM